MPSDRMTSPDGKLSVRSFVTPEEYQAHREPVRPQRIHIIGTSGTGKSTFSSHIADLFGIPRHDLDAIGYEGAFEGRPGIRRPLEDRLRDVSQLANSPAWITEGIFLWWVDELLQNCALIIWLDFHWLVAGWRGIKREVRRKLTGQKTHGLLGLPQFVWWMRQDYRATEPEVPSAPDDDAAVSRAGTFVELSRYQEKTVRCAGQREVNILLEALEGPES